MADFLCLESCPACDPHWEALETHLSRIHGEGVDFRARVNQIKDNLKVSLFPIMMYHFFYKCPNDLPFGGPFSLWVNRTWRLLI